MHIALTGSGPAPVSTVASALAASGLNRLDAEVLLAHAVGRDRAWLVAHARDLLSAPATATFVALTRRRRDGEPVAYLTARREFWGLSLAVESSVLIPRPETETLVEVALSRLAADRSARILDLGTGSGAIALALARERPQARVIATDLSAAALAVARRNAKRLGLGNIAFARGDWYQALEHQALRSDAFADPDPDRTRRFDLIVSNPPYVRDGDPHLTQGDLRFEPRRALVAGREGLDALRVIVAEAPQYLVAGGWLVVEHGYDQADEVRRLFETAGFSDLAALPDLAGVPRVAAGRRA